MTSLDWLVPIPVALPLLSAGLALALSRHPKIQQLIALVALSLTTVSSVVLAGAAHTGRVVLDVGSWAAPIGITLVVDRVSGAFLVVSQIVTLAVLVYSLAQNLADDEPNMPIAIYFPTFLVLSAGVANAFLTGDLFNLFVGFEILLAASFVLIMLGGTRGRVRAGAVYVVVSLLSSSIFLAGIALTYAATGTVNMAQLALRLPEIDQNVATMIHMLLLVAFGIKAALFPLQAWLPDSYPTAPAPVTAVFAGLMTKVGVYALIRLEVLLFPGDRFAPILTVVGIATMIGGILGAVAQDDIKRLLSFTLVSHIGFMMWGLAISSRVGVAAVIYYAAHHILVQTALFLIAGLIERRAGTTSLAKLSGFARSAPIVSIMFFIAGVNLVGVPPLTGFIGKFALAQASVEAGTFSAWALLAGGIITSFLTLYVVIKWWHQAFWQTEDDAPLALASSLPIPGMSSNSSSRLSRQFDRAQRTMRSSLQHSQEVARSALTEAEAKSGGTSRLMSATVAVLVGVQIAMAALSGPIWNYVEEGARDQLARTPYINAVLGGDGRGSGTSDTESGGTTPVVPSPDPTASPIEDQQSEGEGDAPQSDHDSQSDSAQSGRDAQSSQSGQSDAGNQSGETRGQGGTSQDGRRS